MYNDIHFRAKIEWRLACNIAGVYDSLRKPIVSTLTSLLRSFWRAMHDAMANIRGRVGRSLRCAAAVSLVIYRYLRMNAK